MYITPSCFFVVFVVVSVCCFYCCCRFLHVFVNFMEKEHSTSFHSVFDGNPAIDVRGVFLDISKAFDKVWHDGIIFKLKAYGVEGELLSLLKNYLENREQRVVLNVKHLSGEKCLEFQKDQY